MTKKDKIKQGLLHLSLINYKYVESFKILFSDNNLERSIDDILNDMIIYDQIDMAIGLIENAIKEEQRHA